MINRSVVNSTPMANGRRSPAFAMTVVLLTAAFLFGGGDRDDIVSLMIWRPLSAFMMIYALVFHSAEAWRRGKWLVLFAAAVVALVLVHLIPLPPSVWSSLPGRDIIVSVYRAAGMNLPWLPLSMAQARSWNALFSLAGPVAMLLFALALPEHRQRQLLHLLLAIGLFSGVLGMMQALGPPYGPLYLYSITNNGTSVGLFANRNHQAAMLTTLLPLLAASLSLFRGKPDKLLFHRALSWAFTALLIPLILLTGSRTGLLLSICAAALAWWWVYQAPEARGRVVGVRSEHRSRLVGVAIAVVLVSVVAIIAARTPALERLTQTDPASELRIRALPTVLQGIWKYFPAGSGIGTFVEAYQISEPDALISAEYFNHAHDDFLELIMTGGLPALLILVWAAILGGIAFSILLKSRKLKRGHPAYGGQVLGRAGLAVVIILALASATDYPLRVPSLLLYATLGSVWCSNACRVSKKTPHDNDI